ncbi:MAG: hypothetical protein QN187_12770 [Armatimonadota bacterium]|nr:hypothetical protein [Armatimonadota bacterium]
MHVAVRPARPEDGTLLVGYLEAAYGAGYLPTFDRDGPPQPRDLWWVGSEKEVSVIEVDRRPAGMLVVGRHRGQWLVEEILAPGFGELAARRQEALVQRVAAHLVALFQRGGQAALLLRCAETGAFGLALARHLTAALANALLVYRYRGPRRPAVRPPEGYEVRRATPADARALGRLVREVIPERGRAEEVERVLAARDGRGFLALREAFPVGFAAVDVRAGGGAWTVGVREGHRRRGIGRALAASVLGVLHAREPAPWATAWALDPMTGPFLRALGFGVERTYLYLERPL